MSNKCSAASLTGVSEPSRPHTFLFDSSIYTSRVMTSKTTLLHIHMFCRRTFFEPSLLPPIFELKSLPFCMGSPLQTTSKSKRSKSVDFRDNLCNILIADLLQAVAWVPQRGSNNSVELPAQLPKDDFLLKDLEPLGWIKTQALEINHLSPTDVTTQAKLMAEHPEWGSSSICMTASFTPGSVSLSAHSLTVAGFEWGRKNQDISSNPPVNYPIYLILKEGH